ncbi:MAG: proton-conducting membrane transporter [Lachnospiraceae bacterium]|nr:proton-conducting membrane transporter [Lachnospiraceae bacterium]
MSPLFLLLPILIPVIGGFLLIPLKPKTSRVRNIYSECVVVLTSILVWVAIFTLDRESVELYSFTRGFSIDFMLDGAGMLFAGMVSLMWPLVMLYAFDYMENTGRKNVFFAFYIMTYGITLGIAFASNMTTMYTFFEMLTLVTIPLVSYYESRESRYAGRKYAAFCIGGASLGFFAVIMTTLYGKGGNFILGGSLIEGFDPVLMQLAFLFGFFGFGVKAAVVPLHDWLPTASVAPTPVTALLHAVAVVNSGVFAIVRLTYYTFGTEFLDHSPAGDLALYVSIFSLLFSAWMALGEGHFKRRLAYSTVSNLSYMLMGLMLMSSAGLEAGLLHMLFHGIIKMSLFLCAGAFMHVTGKEYVKDTVGVGRKMPVTFAFYTMGGISLTGVPLFCGFVSKWKLLSAAFERGDIGGYAGILALLISALLCAIYTLGISMRAFFAPKGEDLYERSDIKEAHALMQIPIIVFGIINVVLGIYPAPILKFVEKIVVGLI